MSKTEQMEVLIAVYLFEDLGKKDYDAVMDLVEAKEIRSRAWCSPARTSTAR